jgi:hypothetical protein
MTRQKDYMPSKDSEFDTLQSNVYGTATSNATQWLIPKEVITSLDPFRLRWNNAYTVYLNPAARTKAVTREKNDAKKEYRSMLRTFIQGQIMHNPLVSDAARISMGLPVYDRKPTQVVPPKTRPDMDIIFSQILKHFIHVRDSESKSAGKPKHVIGFELWRRIGGDTTPKYDEMTLVEVATRSPHKVEYTSVDRGTLVWYAARWVNTRGEKGPWSETVSAIVP